MKMTKKERFIEKLDTLSKGEKREITDFFTKHPNYENHIDWNNTGLVYQDFKKVFSLAKNSTRTIKRKAKADPRVLFEKYNCEIIRQTEDFLIVVPFDWECAVFFNSFECGGEGARWCIGNSDDAFQWNRYLEDKNVFFLVFFINKHPVFGRKVLIHYHIEHDNYILWFQDSATSTQIFSPLDTTIELIRNSANRFLSRICRKGREDYILKGSVIIKCYDRKRMEIPAGITVIGPSAFSWCKSLASITLPAGLTDINTSAFSHCVSLKTVDIPDSVTNIADYAFDRCENITSISIPNNITTIKRGVFCGCKSLSAINIPDSVTVIEDDVFKDCESLSIVDIPDSITVIGNGVFSGCKNIRSITIGKKNRRFSDIDGILFDKVKNSILYYPAGKQDAYYSIPACVAAIGDAAFFGCKNLVSVDLPNSVTVIGDDVFFDCDNLRDIIVGNQNPRFFDISGVLFDKIVNRILRYPAGKQDACYAIPDCIATIGNSVFSGCESLVSIDIPNSVTVIEDDAFSDCKNLRSITVGGKNPRFFDVDGVLFDKTEKRILHYPVGKQDACYAIPDGIATIGNSVFSGCENLAIIDIPDSVTAIGKFAFSNCRNLAAINIPDNFISIGDYAFSGCENLKEARLSRKINISKHAFYFVNIKIFYTD